MIELIIFDCDGVIMDSEVLAARGSATLKTELGYPISTKDHIRRFCGLSPTSDIIKQMWSQLPKNYPELSQQRSADLFHKELQTIPHIIEALSSLTIPYCIASNSMFSKLDMMMKITNMHTYFDKRIFSSQQVEHGKPAPDIYFYAAKMMGVNPKNCLVIEDSIAGATAGLSADMNVAGFLGGSHQVYLDNETKLRALGIEHIFDDMTKLSQIINRFTRKVA